MTDDRTALTDHFKFSEFDCHDGTPVPKKYYNNVMILAEQLEVLRDSIGGIPIHITSGFRTTEYNAKKKGAVRSQHLVAKAADVIVKGKLPQEIYYEIENLIAQGKMKDGGLGLYDNFVHYDIRAKRARW